MKKMYALVAGLLALTISSCGGQKSNSVDGREAVELTGAGATFPLPFYTMTFNTYNEKGGDNVSYGGIGSGGGVRNLKDGIVDFCGSDAYLSDEEMKEMKPVVHVPTCMGAVVLAYNLPGVEKLNPDAKLPAADIMPVYRSDGSGTTFVFTDYLSKVSENWKNTLGAAKSVNFPVGQAAKGNPGVAGIVGNTPNTIGYIGSEYAFAQKLAYANVKNKQGEMITPSTESISAAAGDIPQDTRCSITDADAPGAYPISCFTWLIIYQEQNYSGRSKAQAQATVDLLEYVLSDSVQQTTTTVHYAPLPRQAVDLSLQNLKTVTYDGQPLVK